MIRRRLTKRGESGYIAVLTGLLMVVLLGMAAFAIDVGNWYLTGRQAQNAADAASLAGVPNLPADPAKAFSTAQTFSAANDFASSNPRVTVVPAIDGSPTRLRVTVSKTVDNVFGELFGLPTTTITRTAVADFAGPVPLGSPCNEYGHGPEDTGQISANCSDTGQFWANVGSPKAPKVNGDAYQNGACSSESGCTSGTNVDYDANGYFYTVEVKQPVSNLTLQVFDPALIEVGDHCEKNNLDAASALPAGDTTVSDPATRYAKDRDSAYCTGDIAFTSSGAKYDNQVATQYTVRNPGPNPWDPLSYPVNTSCAGAKTYPGYSGDLSQALKKGTPEFLTYPAGFGEGYVASVFRQWVPLCTITNAGPGKYMIQIKTNGLGADNAGGHNRFALRAFGSGPADNDNISISGFNKMAMYANMPGATSTFYLARVPSGSAGQTLNVSLFDVGDGVTDGTIEVQAPPDSGVTFTDCVASGAVNANLPTCQLTGVGPTFNGKWQKIAVPIPKTYTCDDTVLTKCWVKLKFTYGAGTSPNDTTSWGASIDGDPVRLVE